MATLPALGLALSGVSHSDVLSPCFIESRKLQDLLAVLGDILAAPSLFSDKVSLLCQSQDWGARGRKGRPGHCVSASSASRSSSCATCQGSFLSGGED